MKKINLRDYYPYYTQDMLVEVPDEVADILREYKLAGREQLKGCSTKVKLIRAQGECLGIKSRRRT